MSEMKGHNDTGFSALRLAAAIVVGLIGAVFVWVATPYVDIVINCNANAADMSDGYLPSGVMFFMLFLVLVANPLLRWLAPRCALRTRELAIAFGMMLVGGYMGGDGLMRRLPYYIIGAPIDANRDKFVSDLYVKLDLPPALFPEKLGYELPTPSGDDFRGQLPPLDRNNPNGPTQPMPWGIWVKPLLAWGAFFLSAWLLMIGLAQIVVPQWRDNERLPFPLLSVQQRLIESPGLGNLVAPLFRSKAFWVAASLVFLVKFPFLLQRYMPGVLPVIPLEWSLQDVFQGGALRYLPSYVQYNYLFFIIIGVSFFISTRITFSVWFFMVAYAIYTMLGTAYFPPFQAGTIGEHRNGAAVGLTIAVLWLDRHHWVHVLSLLFRPAQTARDVQMRRALLMMLVGGAGMFAWMSWIGVPWGWSLFFVAFVLTLSLLVTRLVAETGLPYAQVLLAPGSFMYLLPTSWISPVAAWFAPVMYDFFSNASVTSPAALSSHAIQLDERSTPRHRWRYSLLLIAVMAIGMVICGGVHLWGNYHHSITMDGKESPLNPWWFNALNRNTDDARKVMEGTKSPPPYNRPAHLAAGVAMAAGLEWLSLLVPAWPLHPIGLLVIGSWYINRMWFSIFVGWLLKVLVLRYGKTKLYRQVTPFFLGLIVGDVMALIFWGLVPAALIFLRHG